MPTDTERLEWVRRSLEGKTKRLFVQKNCGKWHVGKLIPCSTCYNKLSEHETFREAIDNAISLEAQYGP